MAVVMTSLGALHRSMMAIKVDIQQFRVKTGSAEFDCLFSVRSSPFILALTSRGAQPEFFRFEVTPGYCIKPYLGEKFGALKNVLKIDGRSGESLKPAQFLEQLNGVIPHQAKPDAVPNEVDIVRLRPDLEEPDKPYFDTWIPWTGQQHPSQKNLNKTLEVLGPDAYQFSQEMRASSKWSQKITNRSWRKEVEPKTN